MAPRTPCPVIAVEDLAVTFAVKRGPLFRRQTVPLKAVDGVSSAVRPGETLIFISESGCGKTTTARAILLLETPSGGRVLWQGQDAHPLGGGAARAYAPPSRPSFRTPLARWFRAYGSAISSPSRCS